MCRLGGQALYGRTGALYTRFELIRSLGMQKDHTRTMLDEMQKQELSVNDMLHMLEEQAQLVGGWEGRGRRRLARRRLTYALCRG